MNIPTIATIDSGNGNNLEIARLIPTKIFELIEQRKTCQGFVILIDDIYKPPDYERVALKFLNHLQTFTAELTQQLDLPNVRFFISAPLWWRMTLNEDQAYSGSVSREEVMPQLTIDQAYKMVKLWLPLQSHSSQIHELIS